MNPKGFADTLGMLCHHRWRASWARGLFDLEGAANRSSLHVNPFYSVVTMRIIMLKEFHKQVEKIRAKTKQHDL